MKTTLGKQLPAPQPAGPTPQQLAMRAYNQQMQGARGGDPNYLVNRFGNSGVRPDLLAGTYEAFMGPNAALPINSMPHQRPGFVAPMHPSKAKFQTGSDPFAQKRVAPTPQPRDLADAVDDFGYPLTKEGQERRRREIDAGP